MRRSELGTVAAATGARAASTEVQPPRVIDRRPALPGGRALVGGLLMAVAAVGVFLAYTGATKAATHPIVVAGHDLAAGTIISPADLRTVQGDLPTRARGGTFDAEADLVGRLVLVPLSEGEILQASMVTDDAAITRGTEVSLTLPRDQVAIGRLKSGERVDVYVTHDERTSSVALDVEVVRIATASDGSLTSEREVTIVVSVPTREIVAALVHALRTGEVTLVRATFADRVSDGGDSGE